MQLTKIQSDVLGYIKDHREEHGISPTMDEIRQHFGWSSYGTVDGHLDKLQRRGAIRRHGVRRGVEVLDQDGWIPASQLLSKASVEPSLWLVRRYPASLRACYVKLRHNAPMACWLPDSSHLPPDWFTVERILSRGDAVALQIQEEQTCRRWRSRFAEEF